MFKEREKCNINNKKYKFRSLSHNILIYHIKSFTFYFVSFIQRAMSWRNSFCSYTFSLIKSALFYLISDPIGSFDRFHVIPREIVLFIACICRGVAEGRVSGALILFRRGIRVQIVHFCTLMISSRISTVHLFQNRGPTRPLLVNKTTDSALFW